MYGNFSKANMDTQTSSHMLLKNNSTEALNQILFPARERVIFEHLVFYYILLYCGPRLIFILEILTLRVETLYTLTKLLILNALRNS